MTILPIIRLGHPTLRLKAKPLSVAEIKSQSTQKLIKDMRETMLNAGGIGIAAPQVDVSKQIAIINIQKNNRYQNIPQFDECIVINPKIEVIDSNLRGFWEGCLSIPQIKGYVKRPKAIKVSYLNEHAEPITLTLDDFRATVFQHEIDHLFGRLFIDCVEDTTKISFDKEYEAFILDK